MSRERSYISTTKQRTAELLGQTAGNAFVDYLRRRVGKFELEITGSENIESLKNQPYIVVANHIKTKGLIVGQRELSITPDAFILEKSIKDLGGREPKIVASSDFGFVWHENPVSVAIQRKVESLRESIISGAGFIPIKRGDGKVNLKFFRQVRSTLAKNSSIIIFPEGNSYWNHEAETPLKNGVAILAQKNNVPIVPARIDGATSWSPKYPISISFKEPISPKQQVSEIMDSIRRGIKSC